MDFRIRLSATFSVEVTGAESRDAAIDTAYRVTDMTISSGIVWDVLTGVCARDLDITIVDVERIETRTRED